MAYVIVGSFLSVMLEVDADHIHAGVVTVFYFTVSH